MRPIPCEHCETTFDPPRRDAKYCSPKCKQAAKDQRRKTKRLERDRKRKGVEPKDYRKTDPASVASRFGFSVHEEDCDPWDF